MVTVRWLALANVTEHSQLVTKTAEPLELSSELKLAPAKWTEVMV